MEPSRVILGIDTSCDDTGIGIVEDGIRILANVRASQEIAHSSYGGVVPTLAARRHGTSVHPLIALALERAGVALSDLSAIAVTNQQGLAPALAIGVSAGKALALATGLPLIPVHHVDAHVYSIEMSHPDAVRYPFLCLAVAGGHTMLLLVDGRRDYSLIGTTRDDAAGEALDKFAREVGLGYPGGPAIERAAATGRPERFAFPRPMATSSSLDLSFSGLKTAANRILRELGSIDEIQGDPVLLADLAASFQAAVFDTLLAKCTKFLRSRSVEQMAVVGGVAANELFRERVDQLAAEHGLDVLVPPRDLCVDNGAMIAGLAHHLEPLELAALLDLDVRPNAELGLRRIRYRAESKYR